LVSIWGAATVKLLRFRKLSRKFFSFRSIWSGKYSLCFSRQLEFRGRSVQMVWRLWENAADEHDRFLARACDGKDRFAGRALNGARNLRAATALKRRQEPAGPKNRALFFGAMEEVEGELRCVAVPRCGWDYGTLRRLF